MTNRARTRILILVLTGGLAACNGASPSSPTAPSSIQTPPTPRPNDHGEYLVDVTLSGVVFEMTPAGRRPIEGVQFWSSEQAMGVTDANGVFRVRPVWVCPCEWAPLAEAGMTSIQVSKEGYEDPAGLPALFSPYAVPGVSDGWRDVKISGDTRLDIQLVRR